MLYKIYAAVIRNRLYSYLEDNEYVDKHVQKGFWPSVDGVYEHTQMLAHMMREAKRHQRTLIVTLLDLRNAFGEVNHNLIYSSLRYHNVPEEIICIIKDIYTHSWITVAHRNANTELIQVDRGVLQGDPCSPLIFNICFNPLMQTVIQSKYLHLGYMLGPNASRLTFDLRIYDISYTWIKQTLDSKISNAVRDWMEFPISTCVSEILSLPANQGGHGIPSLKEIAEKLRLGQRFKLHSSSEKELRVLFETTSDQNVRTDSIILTNSSRNEAIREVKATHIQATFDHIVSLKLQGRSISSITENLSKTAISRWTRELDKLAAPLFNFVRKALVQQLPTATNLVRWGKSQDPLCLLCKNASQTNKHVLSNCVAALDRYTKRHDAILRILADWISNNTKPDREIFVDLSIGTHGPLSNLFQSLRPDVAIIGTNRVDTLELTVCHETNLASSKQYKSLKYADIRSDIKNAYSYFKITNYTIEVTTLGLISDTNEFCHDNLTSSFPVEILNQITEIAISNSFEIYCNRNIKLDS